MNLIEIKKQLDKMFKIQPNQGAIRNIIFWYDEFGSFVEDIDLLFLENVKIIKAYNNNMFAIKLYIEETDTESNLLVYSPMPRPSNKENWLTDIIKYSKIFLTDEVSLHLLNLEIDSTLRYVVERYKLFFRSSDRYKKFESYGIEPYTEAKINIGVLSVLCKLSVPNLDNVVRALLIEMAKGETALIDNIVKFGDIDILWNIIKRSYGYNFPEQSFEKLAILLFVTHLHSNFNGKLPILWEEYISHNTNCIVFIDNFMKNMEYVNEYKVIADIVAEKLGLDDILLKFNIDEIIECDTFSILDKNIILRICENINLGVGEYEKYREIISHRRNRRFFPEFKNEYATLNSSCEFFQLCNTYSDLSGADTTKLFENYKNSYYKIDFIYRQFILACDKLSQCDNLEKEYNSFEFSQIDSYVDLCSKVENTYSNWYLNELSIKWCSLLDDQKINGVNDENILDWKVSEVIGQQNFYNKYIRSFVDSNERIIVIISDGLRYESALELIDILNAEQKGVIELHSMLGVIPSYTKLGMASLLPHKDIEITNKAEVLIDSISSQGTDNRGKILKKYKSESVAITYEDLILLSKQKTALSEKFVGVKLIYIYHNCIDARGDNKGTEHEVFDATEKCFAELSGLIKILRNGISAINMVITSDHGYIYKRTPLTESDKTSNKFPENIESKRRFFLSKNGTEIQGTQKFSCSYLKGNNPNLNVVVPRTTNCYRAQGASVSYVHGGTSLQEIVIPVIKFKSDKNSSKSMSAKKVSLSLMDLSRKLTNSVTYLSFFQNERIEEKVLPVRVKAYFIDEKGERVSNENIIIAESTSINPQNRSYKEKFTLKNVPYDNTKQYYLILQDESELVNKECIRIPFKIDLIFDEIKLN